ncbi:hypothetical protein FB451DRAFT_1443243 [Mycena latifolia]|nr:hypothetical protein FB451DRAFT_1443243 [Mycena latifolia]
MTLQSEEGFFLKRQNGRPEPAVLRKWKILTKKSKILGETSTERSALLRLYSVREFEGEKDDGISGLHSPVPATMRERNYLNKCVPKKNHPNPFPQRCGNGTATHQNFKNFTSQIRSRNDAGTALPHKKILSKISSLKFVPATISVHIPLFLPSTTFDPNSRQADPASVVHAVAPAPRHTPVVATRHDPSLQTPPPRHAPVSRTPRPHRCARAPPHARRCHPPRPLSATAPATRHVTPPVSPRDPAIDYASSPPMLMSDYASSFPPPYTIPPRPAPIHCASLPAPRPRAHPPESRTRAPRRAPHIAHDARPLHRRITLRSSRALSAPTQTNDACGLPLDIGATPPLRHVGKLWERRQRQSLDDNAPPRLAAACRVGLAIALTAARHLQPRGCALLPKSPARTPPQRGAAPHAARVGPPANPQGGVRVRLAVWSRLRKQQDAATAQTQGPHRTQLAPGIAGRGARGVCSGARACVLRVVRAFYTLGKPLGSGMQRAQLKPPARSHLSSYLPPY